MEQGLTCLVTIHGIGFQQQPLADGTPGYADSLHERLSKYLDASVLGDDPGRKRTQRGQNGPVYVASEWPPDSRHIEEGLRRLGVWASRPDRIIDTSNAPLTDGHVRIAHVALVYARLQDTGAHPGTVVEALTKALFSLHRYASPLGLLRMLASDARVALPPAPGDGPGPSPSLRVRREAAAASGPDLLATLRQLEDDVTTYVSRNDLRERVRGFVREALLRLCSREDVQQVVINSHSQGTVLAYDVVRQLPPFVVPKIKLLITAGSPLRKYADLFYWGQEIGCIAEVKSWMNYWDPRDPVADPLTPPMPWRPGAPIGERSGGSRLFRSVDPNDGKVSPARIEDRQVDNVSHSGAGSLPAHNYWDNEPQFVNHLARILSGMIGE